MDKNGFNLAFIQYKPRWKWFRPPFWWIFRWAYVITDAREYVDCYPVSMSSGDSEPMDIECQFKGAPLIMYESQGSRIAEMYEHWLDGMVGSLDADAMVEEYRKDQEQEGENDG